MKSSAIPIPNPPPLLLSFSLPQLDVFMPYCSLSSLSVSKIHELICDIFLLLLPLSLFPLSSTHTMNTSFSLSASHFSLFYNFPSYPLHLFVLSYLFLKCPHDSGCFLRDPSGKRLMRPPFNITHKKMRSVVKKMGYHNSTAGPGCRLYFDIGNAALLSPGLMINPRTKTRLKISP